MLGQSVSQSVLKSGSTAETPPIYSREAPAELGAPRGDCEDPVAEFARGCADEKAKGG